MGLLGTVTPSSCVMTYLSDRGGRRSRFDSIDFGCGTSNSQTWKHVPLEREACQCGRIRSAVPRRDPALRNSRERGSPSAADQAAFATWRAGHQSRRSFESLIAAAVETGVAIPAIYPPKVSGLPIQLIQHWSLITAVESRRPQVARTS